MLGAQPVLDAGDVQDENLGAGGEIGVIGNLQDKSGAEPFGPALFHWKHRRGGPGTQCPLWVDTVEKVVSDRTKRNNRIRAVSYLNRNCRNIDSKSRPRTSPIRRAPVHTLPKSGMGADEFRPDQNKESKTACNRSIAVGHRLCSWLRLE